MDKNQVIGIVLIFALLMVWQQFFAPSPEQLEAEQIRQDSIAMVDRQLEARAAQAETAAALTRIDSDTTAVAASDSLLLIQRSGTYGAFAPATIGQESLQTIENDVMTVTVSTKGGAIKSVVLKDYAKVLVDSAGVETKIPLELLEDSKNRFEYLLPVSGAPNGIVRSSELFFQPTLSGKTLTLRAAVGAEGYLEQRYTLKDGTYLLDYDVTFAGLESVLRNDAQSIELSFVNYLDKLEVNANYERNYSTIYYKPLNDDADRCSCTSSDEVDATAQPVKWVSAANQFFNTSIIAVDQFQGVKINAEVLPVESPDLKKVTADITLAYNHSPSETAKMQLYIGPNDFERLLAIGSDLTDVIPYGRSIFGAINRWVIRPLFNFFDGITGNKGIAILLLTFLVKLLVFPLTYKMLYSQSKMAAMKPYLEKSKEKNKDDQQAQQMETMKMYREYGVNPLGGCLPMVLQLPIWFALYRFFPADLTFRQEGFLWASDLSSYDAWITLPFSIPLGFGAHISLFAVLWAITTLIYTYYNTKHMDFGANPMMKYFQYIMPVMFLGFFNSFASGLTCYLLFSNVLNITQTVITKNLIIDQDKIVAELEANKAKPKKKSGFQARLESAMNEQKKKQADLEAKKKKSR
ncbi:MAG: membrane protein insertase YidC [Bacteroidetes bacterium]|nr:MAG: membrane protein insertase YidC [Bacteroidota bacterium]PTM13740.1 MAG: membrane protein insertase YidC [Bacteroidota bacterium]